MKYSLVDGVLKEPFKKGQGFCPCCNSETIAKCGNSKLHHWAHKVLNNCDKWWESETQWHRDWKNFFPKEWQEVIHFDNITNEKHIADIKTNNGLVIELQNSPMNYEELNSRELFYDNMIWIVNAKEFKKNLFILDKLPLENLDIFNDICFIKIDRNTKAKMYRLKSEAQSNGIAYRCYNTKDIISDIDNNHKNHYQFDWIKPRKVWLQSNKRVFLDFDDDFLYEIALYNNNGYPFNCIKKFDKKYFISKALESVK